MSDIINFISLQGKTSFSLGEKIENKINLKNKKAAIGARLSYNDLIFHHFKIDQNMTPDKLLVHTEIKMYEDLELDSQKIYKFSTLIKNRSTSMENEKVIEAFAIDQDLIQERYKDSLKKVKHIDYLAIPFLTFETLYNNRVLDKKNDLFIYISKDEAFSTFYMNGSYISTKKTKSINEIIKDLEFKQIAIDSNQLKSTLAQKGLARERYDLLEYDLYESLKESFEQLFNKIKNLAIHNRNVYNYQQIDRIFFTFDGIYNISGLKHLITEYLPESEFLDLNFSSQKDIDSLDQISASYIKEKLQNNDLANNISFFEKSVPFYKSEIGKISTMGVACLLLSVGYFSYEKININILKSENETLQQKVSNITGKSKKLKKELQTLQKDIKLLSTKKEKYKEKFKSFERSTIALQHLRSPKSHYTPLLLSVNKILQKYSLSIGKIDQADENSLNLEIHSTEDKRNRLALFMHELTKMGFETSSNEINHEKEIYKSIITVTK
jgi:hypothetical protein